VNPRRAPLFLSASAHAIDAALATKDAAVTRVAQRLGLSLHQVAVFGDGVNDLPFLALEDVGLRGAPANAQDSVKQTLRRLDRTRLCAGAGFSGFLEFYAECADREIACIITDRDGVLVGTQPEATLESLSRVLLHGSPAVRILTGSSVGQNHSFLRRFPLAEFAARLDAGESDPWLILAENGSVEVNVCDGTSRLAHGGLDADVIAWFRRFSCSVISRVEREVLPPLGLGLVSEETAEAGRVGDSSSVFVPAKQTMLTFDIPRRLRSDDQEARETREVFVSSVTSIVAEAATLDGADVKHLS